ncbi:hypothetical protein C4572_02665 [Candidatus Parcubacteria bacterium]|nr:MAG: hypothetical protein C4572_02665 [Candidatus Parcubacteria bacterium]
MKNLWREETGVYDVMAGSSIGSIIVEAISLSAKKERAVKFEFNGVTVTVRGDSNSELIYRDWSRALSGYIDKNVGPHPNPVLTDEEKASDACIKAENERKRKKRQTEYEKKARAYREKVEAKLANAPAIELADEASWQKFKDANMDGYGGAVVTYSERWARLMQVEMANRKNLEDVADATSHEADLDGITGFMYGCAVSTLAQCWKHGERLRRWHNIKTQIGNEGEKANESGGVLNPALLSFH